MKVHCIVTRLVYTNDTYPPYSSRMFYFDLVDIWFKAIDIISAHPDHDVIIGINNYGKEDLLLQISSAHSHHVSMLHIRKLVNKYLCH